MLLLLVVLQQLLHSALAQGLAAACHRRVSVGLSAECCADRVLRRCVPEPGHHLPRPGRLPDGQPRPGAQHALIPGNVRELPSAHLLCWLALYLSSGHHLLWLHDTQLIIKLASAHAVHAVHGRQAHIRCSIMVSYFAPNGYVASAAPGQQHILCMHPLRRRLLLGVLRHRHRRCMRGQPGTR